MSLSVTITGDGSTHAFSATAIPGNVNAVQLSAESGNGAVVNIGGAEVTPSVGFPLEPGSGFLIPSLQSFGAMSYNAGSGDVFHLLFVRLEGPIGGPL